MTHFQVLCRNTSDFDTAPFLILIFIMKKLLSIFLTVLISITLSAKTTYVIWQHSPLTGSEVWVKTDYYIWENTYTQTNVNDALQLTSTGKGWLGGGYVSALPFDNKVLTDGYELVFDIMTTDTRELSVQLTSDAPEAAQSVKLSFERDGQWKTIRLKIKDNFPKVFKAWAQGGNGYVFSLIGGVTANDKIYLRDIRYEKAY